jgi:hypothetical protein
MPPRKTKPEEVVAAEEPEETVAVPSDSEEIAEEPEVVAEEPVEETPNAEDDPAEPEAVEDAGAPEAEETGTEVGLSPGEEFISERLRDDAVLVVVTNFGRKIEISPDGVMTVVTGPPLDVIIPEKPVSTAVGVLGPKPELG